VADAELFHYISSYRRHMFDARGGMPSKVARSRPYECVEIHSFQAKPLE
jgi:hypothetical protein